MMPDQAEIVQETYAATFVADEAAVRGVLEHAGGVNPIIHEAITHAPEVVVQSFIEVMSQIAENLHSLDSIADYIAGIGEQLYDCGIRDEDYDPFCDSILSVLATNLADSYQPDVEGAWRDAYATITGIMREAAHFKNIEPSSGQAETVPPVVEEKIDVAPPKQEIEVQENNMQSQNQDQYQAQNKEEIEEQVRNSLVEIANIQEVSRQISDVAKQTNLLALNAKIEAARTGDAGKGFQVVANEVKSLAGQSGKATESINQSVRVLTSLANNLLDALNDTSSPDSGKNTSDQIATLLAEIEKVGLISKRIDEVARETNMLALNATIEANRAGEMGKGFAVVAGEVKVLASQTANATHNINGSVEKLNAQAERLAELTVY